MISSDKGQSQMLQLLVLVCFLGFSGCTVYRPPSEPEMGFIERAEIQQEGNVRVTAVVLSSEESELMFNAPLAKKNVQPVWLKIENNENQRLMMMALAMDSDFFAPSEAAWRSRSFGERKSQEKVRYFNDQQIDFVVQPNSTESGFVFTRLDPGAKAFTVRLIGEYVSYEFDFAMLVPGLKADFMVRGVSKLHEGLEIPDLDLSGLRTYLENLPCCVLGGDKKTPGDPLNLVFVGNGRKVIATLVRQGWNLTETITAGSSWRTVWSSVFKSQYLTSPVSPLYLFDRSHDAAFQKARGHVDERNHLRLWRAPVTVNGEFVWVGQISRDIGVKFTTKSKTGVTHKIDPAVDEARNYIFQDMMASQSLSMVGFVSGVGISALENPQFNYTRDPYYTNGLRVVLFITGDDIPYDEIEWMNWESPRGWNPKPEQFPTESVPQTGK